MLAPVVLVLLGILAAFVGPIAARPLVQAKLQAMVRDQLNADLEIGPLAYHFPYGVSVADARLTATAPDGKRVDILSAKHLSIALAKLPIFSGPLVVSSIVVEQPSVHLIKTKDGFVGHGLTVKPDQTTEVRKQKLSEMFQLRQVTVTDGRLIFDDRTVAGSVPLAWKGLKLDLRTGATSAAKYAFDLDVGDGTIASLLAGGWFNIDEMFVHVERCALKVNVDPNAPDSPIPADLQMLMKKYEVSGALALTFAGDVPLSDPARGKMTTTIELPRANGRLPEAEAALDELAVKLTFTGDPAPATNGQPALASEALKSLPLLRMHLDRIAARSRDTFVRLDSGDVVFNAASGAWGVNDLKLTLSPGADRSGLPRGIRELLDRLKVKGQLGITINGSGPITASADALDEVTADVLISPTDVTVQPPELPVPLAGFADFKVQLANNVVTLDSARAEYGKDIFYVRHASVPLAGLARGELTVQKLAGALTFKELNKQYPAPLSDYLKMADPRGAFFFDGVVHLNLKSEQPLEDYALHVETDSAAISAQQPYRVLVSGIKSDIVATPLGVEVKRFDANVLTGKISATALVDLTDPRVRYAADVHARQVDLNGLAQLIAKPGEKPIVSSGDIALDVNLRGRGTDAAALDELVAEGSAGVDAGELLRVKLLDEIISKIGVNNAGAVGEAATNFKLENRTLHLNQIVLNAPAAGVIGSGDVTLDGNLSLRMNARALSDWEKHLRREDGGPVSNVVASMAGTVQRSLDKVAESALYTVHVGGTIEKPDVQVITVPGLRGGGQK